LFWATTTSTAKAKLPIQEYNIFSLLVAFQNESNGPIHQFHVAVLQTTPRM
jgi:hypothetical protein